MQSCMNIQKTQHMNQGTCGPGMRGQGTHDRMRLTNKRDRAELAGWCEFCVYLTGLPDEVLVSWSLELAGKDELVSFALRVERLLHSEISRRGLEVPSHTVIEAHHTTVEAGSSQRWGRVMGVARQLCPPVLWRAACWVRGRIDG